MLSALFSNRSGFLQKVGINALANIIAKAQLFVVAVVLARFFSVKEFASFGVLLTIIGLVSVFAAVGLGPAIVRFIAKESEQNKRNTIAFSAMLINLVLSILLCSLLFLSVDRITNELTYVIDVFGLALKIICPGILFLLVSQVLISFLNGLERFDVVADCQWLAALLALPLQLGLSFAYGLIGFASAFLISNVILLLILLQRTVVRYRLLTGFSFHYEQCRELLSFSLPSFLSGIWPMPLMALAYWVISDNHNAAEQAAVLTSANQVFAVLYFFPVMIAQVLMPRVAAQQEQLAQSEILANLLRKLLPVIAGLTAVLVLISPIFPWLFDFSIWQTLWVFITVILTVAVVSIQTQVDHFNVGVGRVWLHFWLNSFWGGAFLIAILLAQHWGAIGIVVARLVAYGLRSLLMLAFLPNNLFNPGDKSC